ncbi:hypothetical protein MLD38_025255 [Melastoma candidum]|uniref:Uncharacterized protein n=1 Tax=Melastoma candidum TaxID=119954 RepID=A0ACB9NWE0_9MYRT|nr:hypothetical protein MLD38_025255 [Melastoma candidum]
MGYCLPKHKSSRIRDGFDFSRSRQNAAENLPSSRWSRSDGEKYYGEGRKDVEGKAFMRSTVGVLKAKVLKRVFSEDYDRGERMVLDPRGTTIRRWNKIFLVACLVSLFVDPLFFYLQMVWEEQCLDIGVPLEVVLTAIRSGADAFYIIHIVVRFRTAYVAHSSRVFGRGELVIDPSKIAQRYLHNGFWLDLLTALPLPQVLIWVIIPNLNGSVITNTKNVLRFIIIFQYLPRLYLIVPLSTQIVKAAGAVTETAWAGAAYNLVLGACWYLLSIERQEACWKKVCSQENSACNYGYFDCHKVHEPGRVAWFQTSNVTELCRPSTDFYNFGIYTHAQTLVLKTSPFMNKYYYCLWWGLKNLSSLGQGLETSMFIGENVFAIIIAILGLVPFALLIGNMQRYLQSTTVRLEEWRLRKNDTELWMRHRQLPTELRDSIRKYDQYKWVATRGVDEEAILKDLPMDLRRDIKRHLCLDLVRRVHLFDQMDDRMLDAICERLKPALCTMGTYLVREGDPINEMQFIIRGHLDSYTTGGGRSGPSIILPSSTRTVKAITEVEAFFLRADDLKFVAAQFRRLHSKQLRHKFKFYSHHWRTWAACFIQAAWHHHRRRMEFAEVTARENSDDYDKDFPTSGSKMLVYAAAHTASSSTGSSCHRPSDSGSGVLSMLQKPIEPNFSTETD